MGAPAQSTIAERVLAGDVRAAARLMRDLDDRLPEAEATLRTLFPRTGRAYVIGLTGAPGAGSRPSRTVSSRGCAPPARRSGSSRSTRRARSPAARSWATASACRITPSTRRSSSGRSAPAATSGGLSRSTSDLVQVLDAMGKDVVLVETVGVGQDEIEVATLAHTVVVVTVPGLGDDVQAIKAGRPRDRGRLRREQGRSGRRGPDRARSPDHARAAPLGRRPPRQITTTQHRFVHGEAAAPPPGPGADWEPPIVRTVAVKDEGIAELLAAIDRSPRAPRRDRGSAARGRPPGRGRPSSRCCASASSPGRWIASRRRRAGSTPSPSGSPRARPIPYALADDLAARLRG